MFCILQVSEMSSRITFRFRSELLYEPFVRLRSCSEHCPALSIAYAYRIASGITERELKRTLKAKGLQALLLDVSPQE